MWYILPTVFTILMAVDREGARVDALNRPRTAPTKPNDTLWVDKYRPQRFTDLLGDERLHREVLGWVKDYCVFGKKKGKKRAREGDDDLKQQDQYHRPHEKVRRPSLYILDHILTASTVDTSAFRFPWPW